MNVNFFKTHKSEWLLSLFYFFSFFFLISYVFVFCIAAYEGVSSVIAISEFHSFFSLFFNSIKLITTAFIFTIPLTFILTVFLVICDGRPVGRGIEVLMRFFVKNPLILAGASIVFWLRGTDDWIIMNVILVSLLVPRLSLRWFTVASRVHIDTIEAALSIGMSFWSVLYFIYIKSSLREFLSQVITLYISALGMVTPFLYFVTRSFRENKIFSFEIFSQSYDPSQLNQWASIFVLLLLILCLLNTLINDSENIFGEWNG